MVAWFGRRRAGPIGVDIGTRSVKLLQLDADRSDVREAARWDIPPAAEGATSDDHDQAVVNALVKARLGRNFRGREAVFSIGGRDLFVQNIRVAQAAGDELEKIVHFEAAGRLPYKREEAEIRYLEAADVRQGETMRREVILLACNRAVIQRTLAIADRAGLVAAAIDVEPTAMLRGYAKQFRRDEDQQARMLVVNIGASSTSVVVARGGDAMFAKYVDVGGRQMDEAVAQHLKLSPDDASALRRHNGDRRADQRDPEMARSVAEALRGVLEQLAGELSMCIRYYSVTFRGQPLARVVLGGGEAAPGIAEWLSARLEMPCELGNPLRSFSRAPAGRASQWDVAAGLALKPIE
jgi:type IV pilus assembly protein PilM